MVALLPSFYTFTNTFDNISRDATSFRYISELIIMVKRVSNGGDNWTSADAHMLFFLAAFWLNSRISIYIKIAPF